MTRRERGEGTLASYDTADGTRWKCQWREPVDPARPERGKRLRSKGGFMTRQEARDELQRNLARIADRKKAPTTSRSSFDSYARRWLAGYDCEATTRTYIHRVLDAVDPYIGDLPLTSILPSDLAATYRGLETGAKVVASKKRRNGGALAKSTVLRYSGWIVTIFNAAIEEGLLDKNPANHKNSGRPKASRAKRVKPFQVWNAAQVSTFCDWALQTEQPWAHAWTILVRTGLRSGELLALLWSDVDLTGQHVDIERTQRYNEALPLGQRYEIAPPKGGRPRRVALDDETVDAFLGWRSVLASTTRSIRFNAGPVFPELDGRSPTQSALLSAFHRVQRNFAAARPKTSPPLISVHDLRHTHASLLLAAGVDVKVIQERLGHASLATTLSTYLHLMPDSQKLALDRFSHLLSAAPGQPESSGLRVVSND